MGKVTSGSQTLLNIRIMGELIKTQFAGSTLRAASNSGQLGQAGTHVARRRKLALHKSGSLWEGLTNDCISGKMLGRGLAGREQCLL